MNGNNNLNSQ